MNKKGQQILGNFIFLIIFLVVAVVSGLIAGVVYYQMGILDSTLHTVNFDIPIQENSTVIATNVSDFQDILGIVVYPILGLRTSLPYLVYFMIFGFIIALGISAYLSSKNPIFFVLHILFTFLITYFCIIISNTYNTLLTNPFINSMMLPFVIYNKVMLYLPQIVFFTSLLFGIIAFVNLIKPTSNAFGNQTSLNYGDDF